MSRHLGLPAPPVYTCHSLTHPAPPAESRLRQAHAQLRRRNIPLASNQVNYSLVYRLPEKNGVKRACDELGVTLIAYSPIGQGVFVCACVDIDLEP